MLTCFTPFLSFYFVVVAQYYTGAFVLGVGNGVSDGSVIVYFLYMFFAIRGNDDCLF
jgi:hypothetical protein